MYYDKKIYFRQNIITKYIFKVKIGRGKSKNNTIIMYTYKYNINKNKNILTIKSKDSKKYKENTF